MQCELANTKLVEFVNQELTPEISLEVEAHVASCEACQADYETICAFSNMAATWQDEEPRPWTPPAVQGSGANGIQEWMDSLRNWFPTFASATALVLVAVMYFQPANQPAGLLPQNSTVAADYNNLPQLPQAEATQAALVQSVLESSEEQRAEEIQALLRVLKAEMDKRSIATEESLRYIITHQIQGQKELDELYRQVEDLMTNDTVAASPADDDLR